MLKVELMTVDDVFVFPTSFAQQRLWLLDQMQPGDPTYNIAAAVRLRGRLDIEALRESLQEVGQRHESLRTTFTTIDEELVQVVALNANLSLSVIDLSGLPEPAREAEFQRLSDEEAQRTFSLASGPLLRAVVLHIFEDEHVLLLTMHHIISDGWSIGVLIVELSALYEALSTGTTATLPDLPIQYADYATWQREWLQGDALKTQLNYWKKQLAGATGVLELPADYMRPPVQTFRSASHTHELSTSLSASLNALGRRKGLTLFMTLLAGFKTLLYRCTGEADIVLGTPIAGRDRAEIKGLIGFFLNTLVLRTDLSGNPTFDELLERVRRTTVGAYSHQDLPFEKLLEELQPRRDLSRTPLFQVFFNMLNLPGQEIRLPGLSVELLTPREVGAKFDLTLYVRELNQRIVIETVFKADLFSPERIQEMMRQFEHLLSQAVENPAQRISDFSLVTPASKMLLPNSERPLNKDWLGAVTDIFSQHAERTPQRMAVIDQHEACSYGELRARSNQLANYLCAQGIKHEDIVAIYGHRSSVLVSTLLGVMKAGAAFIILDPVYPSARIIDYLRLAKPQGFIHLAAAGVLPAALDEFVKVMPCPVKLEIPRRENGVAQNQFAGYSTNDPGVIIEPDDLAYISFTSGSTGTPKGVQGRHGPLTHFLPWLQRAFGLNETDRYSMLSGLSHDPLHRDIFTPLQLGACICIPSQEDIERPAGIAEWMQRERVTITHLTPAMAQLLTETGNESVPCELRTLRYAFLVGDVLTRRDVARLCQLAPEITCINYYGSTETQRAVSYYVAERPENSTPPDALKEGRAKEVLPLGKGIPDVQLLLINGAGQLAGVGEVSEIYLRSPHIARGYMGDAQLTQERFIENPLTKTNSKTDRLYRTGDLGRYLPDGNVEPLGRADHQVKIRGFRIELGEVEAALGMHAAVRETAVIAREDVPGQRRLVAYVVAEREAIPESSALRDFLNEKLPDYMIPQSYVWMDALPLTPNKKVDRRALPAPVEIEQTSDAAFAGARTPVEKSLADIWARVLRRERIGLHDDFFELGGHSLLAIRLLARVREQFNVELSLREFFAAPTLANVAARIEELQESKSFSRINALQPVTRDENLPLSFAQQRLWFVDQLEPNNPAYNIFAAVRLGGRLNLPSLTKSLNEILLRHEILRTSCEVSDEEPVQVIAPHLSVPLLVTDLSTLVEAERKAEVTRRAKEESRLPFDLRSAPLWRVHLLRLEEEEHVLLLTLHHIISDGWSMGVLLQEMASLYEANASGLPSTLPELPIQYADFAHWQRKWLQGEVLEAQLAYWRKQLDNIPASIRLPTDRPRPIAQSYRGARQTKQFAEATHEALRRLSGSQGVTVFITLLAAFKALLHCYTGQDDLVVGSPIAGRNLIETEELIGCFANTLVLRTDLSGNPNFRELLGRVGETAVNAYAHQDVPFEKLVEELQPKRDAGYTPLFQVSFSLQTTTDVIRVPGLTMSRLPIDNGTAMFDLVCNMKETDEGLFATMEYSTDLFNAGTVDRMLMSFEMLLDAVAFTPDAPLRQLVETIVQAERRSVAVAEEGRKETFRLKLKNIERKRIHVS